MRPGTSFKPMLASPSKGVEEVLDNLGKSKLACEWKYDGDRILIHRNANGKVTLFSRNQIEQTAKYPDIVSRVPKCVKPGTNDFIIDGEVVAWDPGKQAILPFQRLRTRKRKISGEHAVQVQVVVFLFDILYLNGQPLADQTFRERRKLLHDSFTEVPGKIYFAESLDTNNMDEIQKFLEKAIRGNCEGLIVKTLDQKASYEIGKRSHNWLKLKKDYLEGIGDTLDLVVIGGYRGEGRRTGVYGAYLLASYDPKKKNYIAFSKVGTGFSDAELRKQYKDFGKIRIKEPLSNYVYNPASIPLHWFSPKVVWEIKSADFTISPVYPVCAGLVDKEKGLSLRAPRFIRVREDKSPEDATTPQQIYEMYQKQEQYRI